MKTSSRTGSAPEQVGITAARATPASLVAVFSLAIFLNAALLFSVQPLFTKMVLPLLGGSPTVWNTCLLFFQAMLLGGYLYAHVSSKYLPSRAQAALHIALLATALLVLPLRIPEGWSQPPGTALPIGWLLGLLTASLGLPFFLLSAGAPMMQRWFAETRHPAAQNPYFLYAASNLGSFASLLAYPFVIEPALRISQQSFWWMVLYIGLMAVITGCAVTAALYRRDGSAAPVPTEDSSGGEPTLIPDARLRVRWVLLSFAPSSMLIGVTTYFSTDIASVPFLWVIPLSLYLLTFVIVFARRRIVSRDVVLHAQLLLGLPLLVSLCLRSETGIIGPGLLHILAFFATALMCHGALADSRPRSDYLTEFYLWMSLGGVLGGVFNVLVAPLLFDSLIEYPLALAVAFALRPTIAPDEPGKRSSLRDVGYPVLLFVVILLVLRSPSPPEEWFLMAPTLFLMAVMFVLFFFWKRPLRLALGALAMYVAVDLGANAGNLVMQDRSFFGMYRVHQVENNHILLHGTTQHGGQSLDPERRTDPLTYYYRGGPVSDLFGALQDRPDLRVAIVGLGTGTIACYGRPHESWTFYEIDPLVVEIARTPRLFSYMRDCPPRPDVVVGDARLKLEEARNGEFDIIILDAFSSDAVPAHLITREALAMYVNKLKPQGMVVFHISNRFIDLRPVLIALANDAKLAGAIGERTPDDAGRAKLYDASRWIVLAREASHLDRLTSMEGWMRLARSPAARVWTDDYTDVLAAITW